MNNFLKISKAAVGSLMKYDKVHVVLGNETCDLDSAVSSLVYAFYIYHKMYRPQSINAVVVPILNVFEDEFPIKTETNYLLNKLEISVGDLTFRNQIDLGALQKCNKLSITMVDHHMLPEKGSHLNDCVIEIIDHRPTDPRITENLGKKIIEQVGSCCTLVASIILENDYHILTTEMANLLYVTIILDTINFNKEANRFKSLDIEMANKLERFFDIKENRENIYNELVKARSDVSHLTPIQVLQKDMKVVNGIPMPGVPMLLAEFIKLDNVAAALDILCTKYKTKLVILMGLLNKNNQVFRDIAIYCLEQCQLKHQLLLLLTNNQDLQLEQITTDIDGLILFKQNNVQMSRKQIIPIFKLAMENN